jgi:hypothetical protein
MLLTSFTIAKAASFILPTPTATDAPGFRGEVGFHEPTQATIVEDGSVTCEDCIGYVAQDDFHVA